MNDIKDIFVQLEKFFTAQTEAEAKGEVNFVCPLCGGKAYWGRANSNNHLHTRCKSCGFASLQ